MSPVDVFVARSLIGKKMQVVYPSLQKLLIYSDLKRVLVTAHWLVVPMVFAIQRSPLSTLKRTLIA